MTDDLDRTRRYQLTGEEQRGRRRRGLAVDVLGWPWHPRRLATARYRGQRHAGHGGGHGPTAGPPATAELCAAWARTHTTERTGPPRRSGHGSDEGRF